MNDSSDVLAHLDLPSDMSGLRVLDIGARDGFFSFECDGRGAMEVVAIDYVPAELTAFPVAREILGSRLNLLQKKCLQLDAKQVWPFPPVLFLGVLYHLPHPMRALDIVYDMTKPQARLYLETVIIDDQVRRKWQSAP
jgi:tRNA (mo5U34)-methyltransferase